MNKRELFGWMTASALGLGVGFVVALQTQMLIELGFDWERHWVFKDEALTPSALVYVSVLAHAPAAGAVLGLAQALVLRSRNEPALRWALATVAGFAVLAVAIDWPLLSLGLMGGVPGPVEPIIFTIGGCSLAGTAQFLLLRSEGILAGRWLVLWIAGLFVSLVPTALFFFLLGRVFDTGYSWPVGIFFNGFIVGGVAALVSGKELFAALARRPQISSRP